MCLNPQLILIMQKTLDETLRKEKLLQKIKELLATDLNLHVLAEWEEEELESLLASLREKVSQKGV